MGIAGLKQDNSTGQGGDQHRLVAQPMSTKKNESPSTSNDATRRSSLLLRLLAAGFILGCITPFALAPFAEGDVNSYFVNDDPRSWNNAKYFWHRDGWLFPMYQNHPSWPELGVDAESEWLPLGVVLNVVLATFIWWSVVYLVYPFVAIVVRRHHAASRVCQQGNPA